MVQGELEQRGIGLIGVSYDAVDALRKFATAKGIGFPLLADEGSRVITELGLLDRDLAAHHAAFDIQTRDSQLGVAYPAIFVLDEAGRVVAKRIKENYRAREGMLKLLDESLGVALTPAGPRRRAATGRVTVTVATDSAEYVRWEQTRLHVIFDVEPGWHVYGRPAPHGYTAVAVDIEAIPEVAVKPVELPPTRPLRIESLEEDFQVHEGRFELRVPFAVNVPQGHGSVEFKIAVHFQACSDTECLPPATLLFELSLNEAAAA
jgi:alkyl hydroperoxide reductase subunit AhpC